MNRNYLYGTIAVLLLSVAGVIGLFWMQNMGRVTQLSLNLYFGAWELSQPVQIPALIAISLGCGFLIGLIAFLPGSMRNASKARKLEREIALSGGGDQDAWRS